MNDELLIEAVRLHTILYDLSHPKYMDSKYKNNVWNQIGKKLNSEGSKCRLRWCNIRDQYRKSVFKRKTKNGQKQVKLYKYHEQMTFLNPYFQDRPNNTNSSSADDNVEVYDADAQDSISVELKPETLWMESDPAISPESPTNATPEPLSPRASLSSTITSTQRENDSCQPRSNEALLMEYVLKHTQVRTEHPIDKFLEGISPTLKSLTPYYQNLAKSEIFGIVQKYEIKMLTQYKP